MPSPYNAQIAAKVLERLATSTDSLRTICESPDIPVSAGAVCNWVVWEPHFGEQYAKARQAQAHGRMDHIYDTIKDQNIEPPRLRILVDTIKWETSKVLPKIYGDKVEVKHSGEVDLVHALAQMSPDQLRRIKNATPEEMLADPQIAGLITSGEEKTG